MPTIKSDKQHYVKGAKILTVKASELARDVYYRAGKKNSPGVVVRGVNNDAYYFPSEFLFRALSTTGKKKGAEFAGNLSVGEYVSGRVGAALPRSIPQRLRPVLVAKDAAQATADVGRYVAVGKKRPYEAFIVAERNKTVGWLLTHEGMQTRPPSWICENNHRNYNYNSGKCARITCRKPFKT
jgi:hypothetical protein